MSAKDRVVDAPKERLRDEPAGRFGVKRRGGPARAYVSSAAAALLGVAMLGALYILPYVVRHLASPIGYDAPYYVLQANIVAGSGDLPSTTIRVGTPALIAVLMRATGQTAMTLVALLVGMGAAAGGLAAAAMTRVALGMRVWWVPMMAFLTWAAFGINTMVSLHLDNLLNASLVLGALAAALAHARSGRGWVATGFLLAAAGLAHWPFYLLTLAFYVPAVLVWQGAAPIRWLRGQSDSLGPGGPLLGAAVLSAVAVGAPFFAVSPERQVGVRLIGRQLRTRFLHRLHETFRYWAFALGGVGGLFAAKVPVESDRRGARRLFLLLMGSWAAVSVALGVAQLAGLPTAGARLFSYLFPATLLTGVTVWAVARRLSRRAGVGRLVAAPLVVVVAVSGFGLMTWSLQSRLEPRVQGREAAQATSMGDYASSVGAGRPLVIVFGGTQHPWRAVAAMLPPSVAAVTRPYLGTADHYVEELATGTAAGLDRSAGALAVVLNSDDHPDFAEWSAMFPDRVVALGVFVLSGPVTGRPLPGRWNPRVPGSLVRVIGATAFLILILLVAGSGWSAALLPPDPVVRTAMAPVLGLAAIEILAVVWPILGLSLAGWPALGPLVVAVVGGWVAVAVTRRRASVTHH